MTRTRALRARNVRSKHILVALATMFAAVGVQVVMPPPRAGASTITNTITQSGETAFQVPATVTSITVDAIGAAGADNTSTNATTGQVIVNAGGGGGGEVKATLAVTPGSTLYVEVNTGGGAGHGTRNNGHGGGSSDIRTCSSTDTSCPRLGTVNTTVTPHQYNDPRLIVAAGGGGGGLNGGGAGAGGGGVGGTGPGNGGNGGNGGGLNGAGSNGTASGGQGGTAAISGHPAGTFCAGGGGGGGGDTKTDAVGGSGADCASSGGIGGTGQSGRGDGGSYGLGGAGGGSYGGGGGGGWAGGGGGGSGLDASCHCELGGAGGGAGSSFAVSTATNVTMNGVAKTVAPSVTVTYDVDNDLAIGTAPNITNVPSTSHNGAPVTFTAPSATDEGSELLTVTCDHHSGDVFPIGTTTVTCRATDSDDVNGPVSSTFTVTVNDDDLTLSAAPADITVDSTSHNGAPVTFTAPTAADESGETPPVTCDHNSGDTFPIGTTTVTCTARDVDDTNAPSNSFHVTVRDNDLTIATAPDVTVPSTSHNGAPVTFTKPAAGDEGGETPAVTCDHNSGATFPIGTTIVICRATDADDGNSPVSSSFNVTVNDDDLTISAPPADITVPATGPNGAPANFTPPTAADEGGETPAVSCDHASGSTFPVGTTKVTCTATDSDDTNSPVSNSFNVTVVAPPTITKAFGSPQVPTGGTTTLTFTLTNPSANTVAETGVAFTDPLPSGIVVASGTPTNSCGGTLVAPPGATSVSFTGGTIAAGSSCVIQVNVTATTGGIKNNLTGNVSSANGGTGNTASASVTSCTQSVNGSSGSLTLSGGTWCVTGTVAGAITATPGTAVILNGATVSGSVYANSPSGFTACNSRIGGGISVNNATGFVLIGDAGDDHCAANRVNGNVTLSSNAGAVELDGNVIGGSVIVNNTSGTGAFADDTGAEIGGNTITGSLSCSGNSPISDDGMTNSAGAKTGQCAGSF